MNYAYPPAPKSEEPSWGSLVLLFSFILITIFATLSIKDWLNLPIVYRSNSTMKVVKIVKEGRVVCAGNCVLPLGRYSLVWVK